MKHFRFIVTRLTACLGLMAFLIGGTPAHAADAIKSFKTQVEISRAGVATFDETIDYQFDKKSHGIFRSIPIISELPDKKYLYVDILMQRVMKDGVDEEYQQSQKGSYQVIKIGNPSLQIDGSHVYDLKYQLNPVVRHDNEGDYITLNLIGPEWPVGVNIAPTATLLLPPGVEPKTTVCYVGKAGEKNQDCTLTQRGSSVSLTSKRPLAAGEGITLDVVVPADSFDTVAYNLPSDKVPESEKPSPMTLLIMLGAGVAIFGGVTSLVVLSIRKYLGERKRRSAQTIVAQYDPPDKLLPAEVGMLKDNTADTTEVTATLIHLAIRGHIKISYEDKKQLIGTKKRFLLTRLTPQTGDALQSYETILMNAVFASGSEVYIDELKPTDMAPAVASMRTDLTSRMQAQGYYAAEQHAFSADNVTPEGYKEWAKVEGLKLYLTVVEKDRLKFTDAPEKTPERFSKLLPYAIALGVESQWAEQFKDIDISRETNRWYSGSDPMNAVIFTSLIHDSFQGSIATNFSPPSSSSGAGSGFSGGGFGGGGGGSW